MFGGFGFGGGMPGGFPGGMPGGMGGRRARSGPPADTQKMYDQLGIKKTATQPEIRKAWKRKLVKEHPDRGGDEEKFKMTKMAYEILSDEQKRAVYDEGGLEAIKEQAEGGGGGGGGRHVLLALRRRRPPAPAAAVRPPERQADGPQAADDARRPLLW